MAPVLVLCTSWSFSNFTAQLNLELSPVLVMKIIACFFSLFIKEHHPQEKCRLKTVPMMAAAQYSCTALRSWARVWTHFIKDPVTVLFALHISNRKLVLAVQFIFIFPSFSQVVSPIIPCPFH